MLHPHKRPAAVEAVQRNIVQVDPQGKFQVDRRGHIKMKIAVRAQLERSGLHEIVEVEMSETSEELAWERGLEKIKAGKQLQKFVMDNTDGDAGKEIVAQNFMFVARKTEWNTEGQAKDMAKKLSVRGYY